MPPLFHDVARKIYWTLSWCPGTSGAKVAWGGDQYDAYADCEWVGRPQAKGLAVECQEENLNALPTHPNLLKQCALVCGRVLLKRSEEANMKTVKENLMNMAAKSFLRTVREDK